MSQAIELIHYRLSEAFNNSPIDIIDDSAKHANHPSAKKHGGGHYSVTVRSTLFKGLSKIEQHKLVYDALDDLIKDNTIHALSITTVELKE